MHVCYIRAEETRITPKKECLKKWKEGKNYKIRKISLAVEKYYAYEMEGREMENEVHTTEVERCLLLRDDDDGGGGGEGDTWL